MKTLLLFFLMSSKVFAFSLNAPNNSDFKGWQDANVNFQINMANCPDGVDVKGIINGALAVWNDVSTSRVHLAVVGETTSVTYSNPITIMCDTNYGSGNQAEADGSPGAASVLPTNAEYTTSGIMYLNASSGDANIANYSSAVVSIILAHEIGHLLGLGHSQDLNALMYYDASLKSSLALAQDDIDGISYLYPRNELGGDKPLGCGTIGNGKSPSPGTRLMILICLLAPMVLAFGLKSVHAAKNL